MKLIRTSLVALVALTLLTVPAAGQSPPPAPQVTVGGVIYTQYLYQLKDSLGAGNQNQFSVQRAYINVLGRFTGGIGTRVTVDIAPAGVGNQTVRLKYAFATWTPEQSSLTYKLGLIQTPYVDWAEALWDYRMQGPIAVDRNGYVGSADFGFGVDGRWKNEQINAQVALINGEGYSGGTGDNHKDITGRVSVRLMETNDASRTGGLRLTGYAGIGKATGAAGADRNRFIGTLSYKTQQFTLAGEYTATKDAAVSGALVSAFGLFRFSGSKAAAIARIDLLDPDTDTGNNQQTRFIGGLSYQLTPNVRVLADVDLLSFEAATTPLQDATRQRALFQAQFTF